MADEEIVVKRGRGRPRKEKSDEPEVPKEPKKRGRPTKEEAAAKKKAIKSANYSKAKLGKKNNKRKVITTRDILDANIAKAARKDGRLVEELSPREKAAVIYGLIYNPEATQLALWEMAVDYKSEGGADATRKGYASRWYNSAPIVIFREQFMAHYEKTISEKVNSALSVQKEQLMLKFGQIDPNEIDYTKPEAQRKLLNHLINTGEDGKEKLDALKTIVSMQKDDREAAKDNKVQRFYMPLKCTQCPLHARAEKRRERVAREKAALEAAKKAAEEAGVEFVEPDKNELLNEDDESFLDEIPDGGEE